MESRVCLTPSAALLPSTPPQSHLAPPLFRRRWAKPVLPRRNRRLVMINSVPSLLPSPLCVPLATRWAATPLPISHGYLCPLAHLSAMAAGCSGHACLLGESGGCASIVVIPMSSRGKVVVAHVSPSSGCRKNGKREVGVERKFCINENISRVVELCPI